MYVSSRRAVILAFSAVLFLGVSTQPSHADVITTPPGLDDGCFNCGFIGIRELNIVLADWNRFAPPANPEADRSGDGFVGIDDLSWVLSQWNAGTPPGINVGCGVDYDCDGFVGILELNLVLGHWNQNAPPADPLVDHSGDGYIGIDDLNAVLAVWNNYAPSPTANAVPEPATLFVLAAGCVGIRHRRPG